MAEIVDAAEEVPENIGGSEQRELNPREEGQRQEMQRSESEMREVKDGGGRGHWRRPVRSG